MSDDMISTIAEQADALAALSQQLSEARAEIASISDMLDAGQGDDDGPQIMPDFEPGMSLIAKVEDCLHLLEKRRDVIMAYEGVNWRDDPSADERWNAGLDYAMTQLCALLGVDTNSVTWDAATETLDGDVGAVLGNIMRAKYGEDWGPHDPDALAALSQQLSEARAERDTAEFAARNGESLSSDAIHAIRELLKANDVPTAAFIDDHVGNAIVQRNQAVARAEAAELALSKRDAPQAQAVKALEWRHYPDAFPPMWCASAPIGSYSIEETAGSDSPSYDVVNPSMVTIANFDGLPEAKAAAQADFERRILSALTRPSTTEAQPVEALSK